MADPDGTVKLRHKSIPNVSTERLQQRQAFLHDAYHTAEGLHDFDGPRRVMIDNGLIILAIRRELRQRVSDTLRPGCKHCDPNIPRGGES